MGLLGIILGNGKGDKKGNGSSNPDSFFSGLQGDIYEAIFTNYLEKEGILETISDAVDALGDNAPKITEEGAEPRKIEREDFEDRYHDAVDNVAKTLSVMRAGIPQTSYSKFRDLYLDAINELCFGNSDLEYLKGQIKILRNGSRKIEAIKAQRKRTTGELINQDISDIRAELKEGSREKNAYELDLREFAGLKANLISLISFKNMADLNDLSARLKEKLGKYSPNQVKELIGRRKASQKGFSYTIIIPNPEIDALLGLKSEVEMLVHRELSVNELYSASENIGRLADMDGRIGNPEVVIRKVDRIIQIKNILKKYENELESLEKDYGSSPEAVKGSLQKFYTVPRTLEDLFTKMKEAYQSTDDDDKAVDMLLDFTEALCLPFAGKSQVSNPGKSYYVDTLISLMKEEKTPEQINEFACRVKNLIEEEYGGRVNDLTLKRATDLAFMGAEIRHYDTSAKPEEKVEGDS